MDTTQVYRANASTKSEEEVERGERFAFGANWLRFLEMVDSARIGAAEAALEAMLGRGSLEGKRFLDIGSGSGLSSLAARRLGAEVHSFDYDRLAVACTTELRRRYAPDDSGWHVEQGSALDASYLASLGTFDVVYAWGVLHHTGSMWDALGLAAERVAPSGCLFVAIYNDQGAWSRRWLRIKKLYCSGPVGRVVVKTVYYPYFFLRQLSADLLWLRNPLARYRRESTARGMSVLRDVVDWLGGYPFEVAKPEEVIDFYHGRGFQLEKLSTAGGSVGCNEFVFRREG